MMKAANEGHSDIARLLIDNGAAVNTTDKVDNVGMRCRRAASPLTMLRGWEKGPGRWLAVASVVHRGCLNTPSLCFPSHCSRAQLEGTAASNPVSILR